MTGGSPDREARGQSFMCYPRNPSNINLVDVSDIFYFFCLGEGKGESEATEVGGGGDFLLKITGGGATFGLVEAGGRGAGRVLAGNGGGGG